MRKVLYAIVVVCFIHLASTFVMHVVLSAEFVFAQSNFGSQMKHHCPLVCLQDTFGSCKHAAMLSKPCCFFSVPLFVLSFTD